MNRAPISPLSSQTIGLETPGLADSEALRQISWKTMWASAEAGCANLMSSVQPAYLACDILRDGLCHLGENIHNMMCLEVLVVNMPK